MTMKINQLELLMKNRYCKLYLSNYNINDLNIFSYFPINKM